MIDVVAVSSAAVVGEFGCIYSSGSRGVCSRSPGVIRIGVGVIRGRFGVADWEEAGSVAGAGTSG